MKQTICIVLLAPFLAAVVNGMAIEQSVAAAAPAPLIVNTENYVQAITDLTLYGTAQSAGGIGRFVFLRDLTAVLTPQQSIVRPNRDTVYAAVSLDLTKDATITLPASGNRYISLHGITNEQYTFTVVYPDNNKKTDVLLRYCDPESVSYIFCVNRVDDLTFLFSPNIYHKKISHTRYVYVIIRIFLNPTVAGDLDEVHRLQDAIKISQDSVGQFESPNNWDRTSLFQVASAYSLLGRLTPTNPILNGYKGQMSDGLHRIGTATGWGCLPPDAAIYNFVYPPVSNVTTQVYKIVVPANVPINREKFGFWSISVYNQAGFFQPNPSQTFSINSATAIQETDGSGNYIVYLSSVKTPNMKNWIFNGIPGWNYGWRLYQPTSAAASWEYPKLELVP